MPRHAEKKALPFTPEQMFDLVIRVEDYPQFLPWCVATRVNSRSGDPMGEGELTADMLIGFKMFRESYTSKVDFRRPHHINVHYQKGPFKYLENHWVFEPHDGGCLVDFHVAFEFTSRILEKAIGAVFVEAVHRMVHAFETRATELYGRA